VGLVREEQRVRPYPEEENQRPAGDHHAVGDDDGDLETAMAVGTGTVQELQAAYGDMKFTESPDEVWITKTGIKEVLKKYGLGDQADGSKGYVVKVEEGYWTAVEDWAQADGITPEEWLKNLLYSAISTYGEPAKGR
jgi:hypothetical protein